MVVVAGAAQVESHSRRPLFTPHLRPRPSPVPLSSRPSCPASRASISQGHTRTHRGAGISNGTAWKGIGGTPPTPASQTSQLTGGKGRDNARMWLKY